MNRRPPAWLIPNLLSLDAPIVALVWMWMLARSMRVQYVEMSSYLVLAGAVWCVYVLDRICDVRNGKHLAEGEMPWRHRFHWQIRWGLLIAVSLVASACAYTALFSMSRELLSAGVAGCFLVLCYIVISFFDDSDVAYGKNLVAGLTFAFGVAAPIFVASEPLPMVLSDVLEPFQIVNEIGYLSAFFQSLTILGVMVTQILSVVLVSTHVLLFGLLCVMNISAIDLWERSRRSKDLEVKQESELSLSMGLFVLVVATVISVAFIVDDYSAPLCYAVMASAGLLHVINRSRTHFSLDALRVLADLALIFPVPVVVWLM